MKYLKRFENKGNLLDDINGLLVELKDTNKIEYLLSGVRKSVSGELFLTIDFYEFSNHRKFTLDDIYNDVLTLESYLKQKGHKTRYEYYYDDDESKTCYSIRYLQKYERNSNFHAISITVIL